MTVATIEPPAPPADPADPAATLKRKLLCLAELSPRMIAVLGDILKDKDWSVPIMEPILVVGDRVFSAGDDAFSLSQIDAIFNRELPKLNLTVGEQSIWNQKYRRWRS